MQLSEIPHREISTPVTWNTECAEPQLLSELLDVPNLTLCFQLFPNPENQNRMPNNEFSKPVLGNTKSAAKHLLLEIQIWQITHFVLAFQKLRKTDTARQQIRKPAQAVLLAEGQWPMTISKPAQAVLLAEGQGPMKIRKQAQALWRLKTGLTNFRKYVFSVNAK